MRWPGPDVGRVAFPASDTRTVIFPGSAREMVAFPPAPMFVVPIGAAASGVGTATAVLVTTPVYPMNIVGDGTAGVTVSGVAVFTAAASGVGEALAVFAQLIEAPASGAGTASVVVKPSTSLAASVSSTGTPAVVVKPVAAITAAATCEGIAGVGAWPAATMTAPASGSGTAAAATTARSAVTASASGSGTAIAPLTAVTGPTVSAYTTFSKTTGSAVTITLPAANVGDLWVIAMGTVSGQMGSTPSGWTKRMGNGAWYDGAYLEVWTRTKVAGDPATITTSASGFSSDSPTEVIAMTVANQAGVNASSSILSDGSTTATPHPTPAITTTVAKAVLIRMVSTGKLSAAHTWPAGVTPVTTVINGTSAALSVAVQTGGAAGSQAAVNATPSNGSKYSSGTIAIAPV